MKTTDWFLPGIKPVHAGWYKRRSKSPFAGFVYFNYWDGVCWYYSAHKDPDDRTTKKTGGRVVGCSDMEWCGLEKP